MTARVQRCNAAYRTQKGLLRYCRKTAGRDTAHKGVGPCQEHDLMCEAVASYDRRQTVPTAFQGRGSYTLQMEGPLGDKIEALGGSTVHFNPEGRVADLNFEMVCAKALLAQLIEDYEPTRDALIVWARAYKAGEIQTEPPGRMYSMSDIEKIVVTSAKVVMSAKAVQDLVPLRTVAGVLNGMSDILEREITDSEVLLKIQQEFMNVTNVFRSPERVMRVRPENQLPVGRQRRSHGNLSGGRLG